MRNQSGNVLALSPELFVGLRVGFDDKFMAEFKELVNVRAWDPACRTWWMPVSFMPHVKQLVREHGAATDDQLNRSSEQIQAELDRRIRVKAVVGSDGTVSAELSEAFARLGLHPSAPRWLIDWAIIGWRKDLGSLGAPTTELLLKEEAYQRVLTGGGL